MRSSERLEDSDCIERVRKVYYTETFSPSLEVVQDHAIKGRLDLTVRLTELNGRQDFCLNTSTSCTARSGTYTTMNMSNYDAIHWLGSELYHFRAEVIDQSFCQLQAEFVVYVVNPPLDQTGENAIIACTAMGIGLMLFFIYLRYIQIHGIRRI
jgi:cation channel sperm-associated protein subunit beta